MQTFLPYPSFVESAKALDNKRLGKQRVEAYQILKTLLKGPHTCSKNTSHQIGIVSASGWNSTTRCMECESRIKKTPWYNHPAVKMWKGHEEVLHRYILVVCKTWTCRGMKDTVEEKALMLASKSLDPALIANPVPPKWLGDERFHASHRSNLLRKEPEYYMRFGWKEPDDLPYFWPTKEGY